MKIRRIGSTRVIDVNDAVGTLYTTTYGDKFERVDAIVKTEPERPGPVIPHVVIPRGMLEDRIEEQRPKPRMLTPAELRAAKIEAERQRRAQWKHT